MGNISSECHIDSGKHRHSQVNTLHSKFYFSYIFYIFDVSETHPTGMQCIYFILFQFLSRWRLPRHVGNRTNPSMEYRSCGIHCLKTLCILNVKQFENEPKSQVVLRTVKKKSCDHAVYSMYQIIYIYTHRHTIINIQTLKISRSSSLV